MIRFVVVLGLFIGVAGSASQPAMAQRASAAVAASSPQALVSSVRAASGVGPVALDPTLQRVAAAQAAVMAGSNQLSHEIAGSLPSRLRANGASFGYAVENVGMGYGSASAAIAGWQRSPAHRDNLLDRAMRRMGLASARGPGGRMFWALVMTD